MTAPLDVQGVLEFAGADINAAPGSVQHSLALVAQQHAALVEGMTPAEGQTTTEAKDSPATSDADGSASLVDRRVLAILTHRRAMNASGQNGEDVDLIRAAIAKSTGAKTP